MVIQPDLIQEFRSGAPPSEPVLAAVWQAWEAITAAANPWLDTLATDSLEAVARYRDNGVPVTYGSLLLRTTYHYWYHTGENAAIRQQLGHTGLPDFVGDIDGQAPYRTG